MGIFFVSQNQSYMIERRDKYVWAPNDDVYPGQRTVSEVRMGDYILHATGETIYSISVATQDCVNEPRPGTIEPVGYKVSVDHHFFGRGHRLDLKPLREWLGEHSVDNCPFTSNGFKAQRYMSHLSRDQAVFLLKKSIEIGNDEDTQKILQEALKYVKSAPDDVFLESNEDNNIPEGGPGDETIDDDFGIPYSRNRIFFGAPGTGKSFLLDQQKENFFNDNYERVTFHPDYFYANFVGTYKPISRTNAIDDPEVISVIDILTDRTKTDQEKYNELYDRFKDSRDLSRLPILLSLYSVYDYDEARRDGTRPVDSTTNKNHGKALKKYVKPYSSVNELSSEITYEFVPGPFMRVYVDAKKHPNEPYLLLIEEINRANPAAVFGDVFQLLDRINNKADDHYGESRYPIYASVDIQNYLKIAFMDYPDLSCDRISIPKNMYIWATMNSADQGVYPLDTAFKRRWDFEYIGINKYSGELNGKYVILGMGRYKRCVEWNSLRKVINDFLASKGINEDKQLGPYFIAHNIVVPDSGGDVIDSSKFIPAFKDKVLMYLYEDAGRQIRKDLFNNDLQVNEFIRYSDISDGFYNEETKTGRGIFVFSNSISDHADLRFRHLEGEPAPDTNPGDDD